MKSGDGHGGISQAILEAETLLEAIGLAVGGASVCWESMSGTGVFDDQRATVIVEALMERVSIAVAARNPNTGAK